jgi:hypothetical protein
MIHRNTNSISIIFMLSLAMGLLSLLFGMTDFVFRAIHVVFDLVVPANKKGKIMILDVFFL